MSQVIFNPQSVVVVGASSVTTKWGNWAAKQVIRHQDKRRVYFVNLKEQTIYGLKSLPSVKALPEPVDLAIVVVPAARCEATIEDLITIGVKAVVMISAGFAEVGEHNLQERIASKLQAAGVTLIGPNCSGVWDSYSPMHCLPIGEWLPGRVGLISQSGGMVIDVATCLRAVNVGFSRIVSIGNLADECLGDLIQSFEEDPNTKVIAFYIENMDALPNLSEVSKPVIILSPAPGHNANRATKRHTNSMISYYNKRNGCYHTYSTNDFAGAISMILFGTQVSTGNQLAIITDTGGIGVMGVSAAESVGFAVDEFPVHLQDELDNALKDLLPQSIVTNPIDLINTDGGFSIACEKVFRILLASEEVDALLINISLDFQTLKDENDTLDQINRTFNTGEKFNKPFAFVSRDFSTACAKRLIELGVPIYKDVETATRVLKLYVSLAHQQSAWSTSTRRQARHLQGTPV